MTDVSAPIDGTAATTSLVGVLVGAVTALASLGATFTGHGAPAPDAAGAAAGALTVAAAVWKYLEHRTAIVRIKADVDKVAVATAHSLDDLDPDASEHLEALVDADLPSLKADVENLKKAVDPSLAAKVDGMADSVRRDVSSLSAKVEGAVGLTPDTVRSLLAELEVMTVKGVVTVPAPAPPAVDPEPPAVDPEPVTPASGEAAAAAGVDPAVVAAPTP